MLNRKTIERALAQHAGTKDPSVAARLAVFGPLLKAAADERARLTGPVPSWTQEELMNALTKGVPLLTLGRFRIDPEAYHATLVRLAGVLASEAGFEGMDAKIDWKALAEPALVETASERPLEYLERIDGILAGDPAARDAFAIPVVLYALRAHLDGAADAASRQMLELNSDATQFDEPLSCPVCGADPAVASVGETPRNGQQKRLWCNCCGAHWVFERIRCARCGCRAVSRLKYVHDEAQPERRLHVCGECGEAFPTLFSSRIFSPDVEAVAMSGLEDAWRASGE